MLSMVEYVHHRIQTYPPHLIGVDMTMGNGHDTEFLIHHCREVYAFDIQKEAIEHTKQRIGEQNVHFILDGHQNIDRYLTTFDIAVFNLGYLPLASHTVTTLLETTKIALEKAIEMMQYVVFIVVYPGHDEGYRESQWIDAYVCQLDSKLYNVSSYRMLNKNKSPYVIEIQKRKLKQ